MSVHPPGKKGMTVRELKARLVKGTRLRCILNAQGPCDLARKVDGSNTVDVWFTGDGIPEGKRSFMRWPKSHEFEADEKGFLIVGGAAYLWVVDDFVVEHGNLHVVQPLTQKARDWLAENTDGEQTWLGGALVVDGDYIDDLVIAMRDADLVERE